MALTDKCQGIWGRLFGHKFKITLGDRVFLIDCCARCGMRAGKS